MSPKEKALQLVHDFMDFSDEQEYNTPRYMTKEMAIQCALRTIDEIINSVVITNLTVAENQFEYWEQVKKQINRAEL